MLQSADICHFFLPEEDLSSFPGSIEDYWDWQTDTIGLFPWWGRYHWVLQTHLFLKKAGFLTRITNEMPDRGIVITHRDLLPDELRPNAETFFVCLLVDRPTSVCAVSYCP